MKQNKKNLKNRDLELLFEIGSIRFIQRTWKRFLNPDFENLAEHHFRVAWIAMLIAKREKIENTDKILKMALMHNLAESRTGDVDYLSRQYVQRSEDLGVSDIFADTSLEEEFIKLWKEYEKRESIEAKIVKDADTLDIDLEINEQTSKGNTVAKGWKEHRQFVAKKRLFTKTAKVLWKQIQISNPHDWHYNGRNRFRDGDWKK